MNQLDHKVLKTEPKTRKSYKSLSEIKCKKHEIQTFSPALTKKQKVRPLRDNIYLSGIPGSDDWNGKM